MEAELLAIGEAAFRAGVTVGTLRRWDKEGRLKPIRTEGGHRRYLRSQVPLSLGKVTVDVDVVPMVINFKKQFADAMRQAADQVEKGQA